MENQFVALFIASDLLLFFYLSPLYVLCLDIFLFPVSAAFCSAGISLAILPSPASFLAPSSPVPQIPTGPSFSLGLQSLALPLLWACCFLLRCQPPPISSIPCGSHLRGFSRSSRCLFFVYLQGSVSHGPCHSQQQADMLSSSLPTVADRLSAKVLGIRGCLWWLMPVLPVSRQPYRSMN